MGEERVVKLGRKMMVSKRWGPLSTIPHHWAIKVGDTWYEIAGLDIALQDVLNGKSWDIKQNSDIDRSFGYAAKSGAGKYGGEIVGKTRKTDSDINQWNTNWIKENPRYSLLDRNCHKYAYELMVWLTDGIFRCEHPANSSEHIGSQLCRQFFDLAGFCAAKEGNAIASLSVAKGRMRMGLLEGKLQVGQLTAQGVCGPGLGLFVDTKVAELKLSAGNIIGGRVGLNGNTGIGARNGNLEAHFLGFGGKVGADGVEFNTPFWGVHACSIL